MSSAGCAWVVAKIPRFRHFADIIQVHGPNTAPLGTRVIDMMRRPVWTLEMLSRRAERR